MLFSSVFYDLAGATGSTAVEPARNISDACVGGGEVCLRCNISLSFWVWKTSSIHLACLCGLPSKTVLVARDKSSDAKRVRGDNPFEPPYGIKSPLPVKGKGKGDGMDETEKKRRENHRLDDGVFVRRCFFGGILRMDLVYCSCTIFFYFTVVHLDSPL